MNKNSQIQGLRGIACILIVFTHIVIKYTSDYVVDFKYTNILGSVSYLGAYGVAIFLIIAGWFLYVPDKKRALYFDVAIFRKYYKLWIPYVISITITYFLEHFLNLGDRTVTLKDYLVSLTMLQGFVVGISPVDGSHWYLTTILMIYFGCLFIENFVIHKRIVYSVWAVLGIISSIYEIRISGVMIQREYIGIVLISLFLRKIYENIKESGIVRLEKIWQDIIVLILGFICTIKYHDYKYCIWVVLGCIIVYLCMLEKLKIFSARWLVWIGEMSYFIYLIHQNVSFMLMNTLTELIGEYHIWYAIIAAIVSILLAILIKSISGLIFKYTQQLNG